MTNIERRGRLFHVIEILESLIRNIALRRLCTALTMTHT
jgi:hypothetical protein